MSKKFKILQETNATRQEDETELAKRRNVELIGSIEPGLVALKPEVEFRMDFVVTVRNVHPGSIARTVAVSAIAMQRVMLEDEDNYSDCLDSWFESGNPIMVYKGKNRDHLLTLKEQAELLHLPALGFTDNSRKSKSGNSNVVCIFGPVNKLQRIVGKLAKI